MKKTKKVSGFIRLSVLLGFISMSLGFGCTSKSKDTPTTLHISSIEKLKGLDPAQAGDLYTGLEVGKVYEPLFQYHYLKRPYVLEPLLAESMPAVSSDGKTYTFKLKKGVLFQDDPCFKETSGKGREMTAEDVVYSFKRLADSRLHSSGWWIFDGKIEGLNAWRDQNASGDKTDYTKVVEGLKALDRYTLQIKLIQKSVLFLYALAQPYTGVVPREAVETYGSDFMNHAVGTGPFKLEEFNPASKVIWVKNPTYRKELYPSEGAPGDQEAGLLADAGKPLPFADRVIVSVMVESQPRWLTFLKGQLDVTNIPKDNFAEAMAGPKEMTPEMKKKGIQLAIAPQLDITHDSFNLRDPVVGKNKFLRQAISLAFNNGPLIELFYGGKAVPAQGPIPPGLVGYDPEFKNPYRQFNLEKAKELLAKAGYPEGKGLAPIEFATLADSTSRQMNEYFEKSMAAIGVKIKFNTHSWPEFQQAVKQGRGQMWGYAWGADYPDAENFLQLFYSKNVSPGPNDSHYQNPEYDKLYEAAIQLTDGKERTELYKKMAQLVIEDCPWVFNVHRLSYSLYQKWLKNYKPHELDHGKWKYYRVEPSLKSN